MPVTTIKEIFDAMPGRFQAAKAGDLKAVIQFDMTGDGGGQYYVTIGAGSCAVAEGSTPNPNMTMTAAASDYIDLINGVLNPMQAFMQGKIKIQGDMSLAMKLQTLFS
jgi:putative sterol carrier protein